MAPMTSTIMLFQSTLPRGSDKTLPSARLCVVRFQSTLPRGSDAQEVKSHANSSVFQSTLPRGSDGIVYDTLLLDSISIHAPSRERPNKGAYIVWGGHNFNPRSLAGATNSLNKFITCRLKFQSTLPRGSDGIGADDVHNNVISIHAPSRERPNFPKILSSKVIFQSTLPRGSDLNSCIIEVLADNFNPRSLAGAT